MSKIAGFSECSVAGKHSFDRLGHNPQIQPPAPVSDILQIAVNGFANGQAIAPANLREPGETGLHRKLRHLLATVIGQHLRNLGPRPYQRDIAPQQVVEVPELLPYYR